MSERSMPQQSDGRSVFREGAGLGAVFSEAEIRRLRRPDPLPWRLRLRLWISPGLWMSDGKVSLLMKEHRGVWYVMKERVS